MAAVSTSTTIQYGKPVDAKDRSVHSAANMSTLYGGVDYDRQAIQDVFRDATDKEYAAKQATYNRTQNQYYNRLATSQNSYIDAMRKSNAQAVMSGAGRGVQAANQLSTLLGLSQQTSGDNTMLTQEGRQLGYDHAAAQAANVRDALQYANEQKLALGSLSQQHYATDAQKYAAELGANAAVATANTAASAEGYAADQGLAGTQYASDRNLEGTRYSADKNYAGTVYNADKNYAGSVYAADANKAAAAMQAAAQRDAATAGYQATLAQQHMNNVASIAMQNIDNAQWWAEDAMNLYFNYMNEPDWAQGQYYQSIQ